MSDLTPIEKRKFERLLGMGDGYVLDFSNRTFDEFVTDAIGRDIYQSKYDYGSGSKANRLRRFWQVEPNYLVGKLMSALIDHQKEIEEENQTSAIAHLRTKPDVLQQIAALREECRKTVTRLLQGQPVPELDALTALSDEKDFEIVARAVRDAIEKNQPEAGLDRLHTCVTKYIRNLCSESGVVVTRDKPLHSLFGEYGRTLYQSGFLESKMTVQILRSSGTLLEAFNEVRNNRSLAHDNPILNYDEALLIFNHVVGVVRFLSEIQRKLSAHRSAQADGASTTNHDDDIPF